MWGGLKSLSAGLTRHAHPRSFAGRFKSLNASVREGNDVRDYNVVQRPPPDIQHGRNEPTRPERPSRQRGPLLAVDLLEGFEDIAADVGRQEVLDSPIHGVVVLAFSRAAGVDSEQERTFAGAVAVTEKDPGSRDFTRWQGGQLEAGPRETLPRGPTEQRIPLPERHVLSPVRDRAAGPAAMPRPRTPCSCSHPLTCRAASEGRRRRIVSPRLRPRRQRPRRSGRPSAASASPPAICTAVVDAPRRTSSAASPLLPECDETPSRPARSARAWSRSLRRYGLSGTTRSVSSGPTAARSSSSARANGPTSSRKSSCSGRRVRFRGPDADAELVDALGRLDVAPDERRGLGAPEAPAEQQPDDRAVDDRPPGGRRFGLEPATAPSTIAGGEHQLTRLVVGERARLARRRARLRGVLAGDAIPGALEHFEEVVRLAPASPEGTHRRPKCSGNCRGEGDAPRGPTSDIPPDRSIDFGTVAKRTLAEPAALV